MGNLSFLTDLLEQQSDSTAEHLDQSPWQQPLQWQAEDRISWWHKTRGADYEPGTFLPSNWHMNIGMTVGCWKTQKPGENEERSSGLE